MDKGKDERLIEAVLGAATQEDGKTKLSCAEALRLAAELGVRASEIGRVCNERGVKITRCQLGCFGWKRQ